MRISRQMAMAGSFAALFAGTASAAAPKLDPADSAAAFKAGGFSQVGKGWSLCPKGGKAEFDVADDMNGDGRPDALIVERNVGCLGGDSEVIAYRLVTKQEDGSWVALLTGTGDAVVRRRKGAWPDVLVGDPVDCRRVFVWKTDRYALDRGETDTGKTCILE